MEFLTELLKLTIPAGLVLYGMYLTTKSFLNKDFERRLMELKVKYAETLIPMRFQAYERMALFLERISAQSLVVRLTDNSLKARELQQMMLDEIRSEFSHNLSQQVYMSDESWARIRDAMETMISVINQGMEGLDKDAPALELSKNIFNTLIAQGGEEVTSGALRFIKQEVRTYF
jgi:predicted AlkP superfamily phosphohydrolase/phosphomutase